MNIIIDGINVTYDEGVTDAEIKEHFAEELATYKMAGKKMAFVTISIDGDELLIRSVEKSPIRRLRRITGYLSQIDSFNEGKRAELNDRVIQTLGQQARPL